jgi:quercetin dioxygenase-like cupin family protein
MTIKTYLLSLPERVVRASLGVAAGVVREVGEVALPKGIRSSQLYQNLVDTSLRFLIEQVGGAEGVYKADDALTDRFLARRTAGNAVEMLGIVAFRASPVWVLAALADLCGMGRHLIPEMADALKAQGLLEQDTHFTSVDQMLDGLERTSSRLAATINTPPLDVAGLRKEWDAIRTEARSLQPASLPSRETVTQLWTELKTESARQNRSVFETSSMMAVSAVRALPDGARWVSVSARVGATRAGHIFATALLDHYRQTLGEIRQSGYVAYASRQLRPYIRAAVAQFSSKRRTLTERVLEKLRLIPILSLGFWVAAHGQSQDTASACIPASERDGRAFGCFIVAAQPLGRLERPATFWHLETFPTRAAAETAKSARGVVLEAFDKVWLLTIGDAGWRSSGAVHVAEIGPLTITPGRAYTAQFMEAVFRPGMKSRVHRHAGPEAWYTLSGETCLETPDGTLVGRAGGGSVIVPQGPAMELTATGTETRKALVLILHDSAQPHTSPAPDWTPKGLCKG